jgi:hypothetical protein
MRATRPLLPLLLAIALAPACTFEGVPPITDDPDAERADASLDDAGGRDGGGVVVDPDADLPPDAGGPGDAGDAGDGGDAGDAGDAGDPCAACAPEAACVTDIDGALACVCPAGYMGDGATCADVDECLSAPCDPNATCTNTPGAFTCQCNAGFTGDGATCTSACAQCHPRAACDANGTCACTDGFTGDGVNACDDVDECADGTDTCLDAATCVNIDGGFRCDCPAGFTGDGISACDDVDECMLGTDTCAANALCANTSGGFQCSCPVGYDGDPTVACDDVDECMMGTDTCGPSATCVNTAGGFQCDCPAGSTPDGVGGCAFPADCAAIKAADPSAADGAYTIASPQGPLDVYCDMTSDGGAGYTMVRFDDASLGASQSDYTALCASYGLQVVVPRSQQHLDAIVSYNGGLPNIVEVTPTGNNLSGISNFQATCAGTPCGYFVGASGENTFCRTITGAFTPQDPGAWTSGPATSCREYLDGARATTPTGYYTIDPDGPGGPVTPFTAYCEMSEDGGGWTNVAVSSEDGQENWTWDRRDLFTTDTTTFGPLVDFQVRDHKNMGLHSLVFEDIFFRHSSTVWASYHGVGDGTRTLDDFIASVPSPNCDPSSGYPKTAGTLFALGGLCSTDLYFNLGDRDGSNVGCNTSGARIRANNTYGPAWSIDDGDGCDFDDPAFASMGPDKANSNDERNARGYGYIQSLNVLSSGNFLGMFLRDATHVEPDGDNSIGQRLVLEADTATAGAACPYGSWSDEGDRVLDQGYVVCGAQ